MEAGRGRKTRDGDFPRRAHVGDLQILPAVLDLPAVVTVSTLAPDDLGDVEALFEERGEVRNAGPGLSPPVLPNPLDVERELGPLTVADTREKRGQVNVRGVALRGRRRRRGKGMHVRACRRGGFDLCIFGGAVGRRFG